MTPARERPGSGAGSGLGPALPVDLKTRFERFPASLKGAFVLRGADGDPHAVRFVWAHIARLPAGPVKPFPVEDQMLNVAPARDLFVPFEVAVSELDPGWYAVRSGVQVDAGRTLEFSSRGFSIAWGRGEMRRGLIRLRQSVRVGDRSYVVEEVDLSTDSATVVWRAEEVLGQEAGKVAQEADATLSVDGAGLEALPEGAGPVPPARRSPGELYSVFYPVPRSARSAAVIIRLKSGEDSSPVGVPLT